MPTKCILAGYGRCCSGSTVSANDLCNLCYLAHPSALHNAIQDLDLEKTTIVLAAREKRALSASERYECRDVCISQRKVYRDTAWVDQLYKERLIKDGMRNGGNIFMCSAPKESNKLCKECASIVARSPEKFEKKGLPAVLLARAVTM